MTEPSYEGMPAGEIIQLRVEARRAERAAQLAELAPAADYEAPERPAGRNPELSHFQALQAGIDEAQTHLTAVRNDRTANKYTLEAAEHSLQVARDKLQRTVDNAEDRVHAASLAYAASMDKERPTRPATIGDLVLGNRRKRSEA